MTQISGDSYEGLDGHKGYVLRFTADGKGQKATVTNLIMEGGSSNGNDGSTSHSKIYLEEC